MATTRVGIIYNPVTLVVLRVIVPGSPEQLTDGLTSDEAIVTIPFGVFASFTNPGQIDACVPGAPPYVEPEVPTPSNEPEAPSGPPPPSFGPFN